MKVYKLLSASYDSNVYLILAAKAVLIDTGTGQGMHFKNLVKKLEKLKSLEKIEQIILTHCHFDHTGGAKELGALTHAKIFIHQQDSNAVRTGDNVFTGARAFGGSSEPLEVFNLAENNMVDCNLTQLRVIHTPGHTQGSISLYEEKTKSLFSGDTVFADGSTGRWDLPGGNYEELLSSVRKLAKLDVRNLYPGHDRFVEGDGAQHIKLALEFLEGFA